MRVERGVAEERNEKPPTPAEQESSKRFLLPYGLECNTTLISILDYKRGLYSKSDWCHLLLASHTAHAWHKARSAPKLGL